MPKLKSKIAMEKDNLRVVLTGEIDHHTIAGQRDEIDGFITANLPKEIIINFANVSFMDSSGIGFILGRLRMAKACGGKIIVEDPPLQMKKVMTMAGIEKFVTIVNN